MKTFEEAMRTMMAISEARPSKQEREAINEKLREQMQPFESVHEEVQHSPEAVALAVYLFKNRKKLGMSPIDALIVAFSHGVMVGIEMEKQPLLVERSQTEAKPESD